MKRKPNIRLFELQVENWNLKYPVGTRVVCRTDARGDIETVTTSPAQMLSGHTPVIWLEGISGCYLLDRVRAIQ